MDPKCIRCISKFISNVKCKFISNVNVLVILMI